MVEAADAQGAPIPIIGLSVSFFLAVLFVIVGQIVLANTVSGRYIPESRWSFAAVVIGGTSLMGGRGSVANTFLRIRIIAVLQKGRAQVGAFEPTKRVVIDAVIVFTVILDVYRHKFSR